MSGEAPPVCSPESSSKAKMGLAHVGSSSAEDDLEVLLDMMDAPLEQHLGCLGKVLQHREVLVLLPSGLLRARNSDALGQIQPRA